MAKKQHKFRALRPLLISFAAVAGLTVGACTDDAEGDYDDGPVSMEVQTACDTYCAKSLECEPDRDEQDCRDGCYDAMSSCAADQQNQALTQLEMCAQETCDDFLGCTISAGAECFFGL